jgi:hypothetical protein
VSRSTTSNGKSFCVQKAGILRCSWGVGGAAKPSDDEASRLRQLEATPRFRAATRVSPYGVTYDEPVQACENSVVTTMRLIVSRNAQRSLMLNRRDLPSCRV